MKEDIVLNLGLDKNGNIIKGVHFLNLLPGEVQRRSDITTIDKYKIVIKNGEEYGFRKCRKSKDKGIMRINGYFSDKEIMERAQAVLNKIKKIYE